MDGQNCKACSGTLPGNPVLKSIRRLVSSCLFKAFVLGILIAVQTFPVNAGSGTSRESGKENGLMHLQVKGNVDWVWNRLLLALETMKVPVFSTIDHKANAVSAGLVMKEARVVSFGNPAAGTLLMQQKTEAALDLPLKILVWESPEGTMLTWNDPAWIAKRYGADPDSEVIRKMRGMIGQILQTVSAQP